MQDAKSKAGLRMPRPRDLAVFAVGSGLGFFVAWIAKTGRVAYILVMFLLAAALVYAVLDLVDYEIAKKSRQR